MSNPLENPAIRSLDLIIFAVSATRKMYRTNFSCRSANRVFVPRHRPHRARRRPDNSTKTRTLPIPIERHVAQVRGVGQGFSLLQLRSPCGRRRRTPSAVGAAKQWRRTGNWTSSFHHLAEFAQPSVAGATPSLQLPVERRDANKRMPFSSSISQLVGLVAVAQAARS